MRVSSRFQIDATIRGGIWRKLRPWILCAEVNRSGRPMTTRPLITFNKVMTSVLLLDEGRGSRSSVAVRSDLLQSRWIT